MYSIIFIFIFCNYFNINARNLRKLNCAEDKSTFWTCYESFSGFGEHNLRSMNIAFITIFIFKNTIFKTFKSYSFTNITIFIMIINRNNFNTSRRNIERNLSTFNYKDLSINIISFLSFNQFTFGVTNLTLRIICGICFIYSRKEILIRTKSMTSYNLSHLTRIKRKGNRTHNIDFLTNFHRIRQNIRRAWRRMSIIFCGIFKNTIPVFRANSKQFNRFTIRTLFKFLGMSIKSYKTITLRERHLSWSNQTGNKTFSLIEDITIFIRRKH